MSGEIQHIAYAYLSDCRDFGKVTDDTLMLFSTRNEALRQSEGDKEKPVRVSVLVRWTTRKEPDASDTA